MCQVDDGHLWGQPADDRVDHTYELVVQPVIGEEEDGVGNGLDERRSTNGALESIGALNPLGQLLGHVAIDVHLAEPERPPDANRRQTTSVDEAVHRHRGDPQHASHLSDGQKTRLCRVELLGHRW